MEPVSDCDPRRAREVSAVESARSEEKRVSVKSPTSRKSQEVGHSALLEVKSFAHQPLQARPIQDVVGEFFIGEHGKGGALGSSHQFRSLFYREVRVLADD